MEKMVTGNSLNKNGKLMIENIFLLIKYRAEHCVRDRETEQGQKRGGDA
jgi:hypothetical protein